MKILYFFTENPLKKGAGNRTRALELLKYFKKRNVEVDFVSLNNETFQNFDGIEKLKEEKLVSECYLLNRKPPKKNLFNYFFTYTLKKWLQRDSSKLKSSNFYEESQFEKIILKSNYDAILISYVDWSDLIPKNYKNANTKLIVDTHDFATAQKNKNLKQLGAYFQEEITRLNRFDSVWVVSVDEMYVFSQFVGKKIDLVPICFDDVSLSTSDYKKTDLVYVASDNPHNIASCRWFFEKVYPLLPTTISIVVVGKITEYISDYKNVTKLNFVEDLTSIYNDSKIAICPMLTGTGVKVKVVEAFVHDLPVVCNLRGIDGLSNKVNNGCLVSDIPFEFAENIIKLLSNNDFYNQIKQQSTQMYITNYHSRVLDKSLDSFFFNV